MNRSRFDPQRLIGDEENSKLAILYIKNKNALRSRAFSKFPMNSMRYQAATSAVKADFISVLV